MLKICLFNKLCWSFSFLMRSFSWAWSRFFHSSHGIWQVVIAHFIRGTAWSNSLEEIEEHRFQRWMAANHLWMKWRQRLLVNHLCMECGKGLLRTSFSQSAGRNVWDQFLHGVQVQDAQKSRIFRFWDHLCMKHRSNCKGTIFVIYLIAEWSQTVLTQCSESECVALHRYVVLEWPPMFSTFHAGWEMFAHLSFPRHCLF